MKNNGSLIYSFVLVVGDALALVCAFVAAYILRSDFSNVPVAHPIAGTEYLSIFLLLLPFWILIFAWLGLYEESIQEKRFPELGRLLVGSFIGLLFVIGYAYITNKTIFPARRIPIYGFTLAFLSLAIFRNLARAFRAWLYNYDIGITNVLLVGDTKVTGELIGYLANRHISGYRIVGVVGHKNHSQDRSAHLPVFDDFDEAIKKVKAEDIHGIIQTELYADQNKNNEILEFSQTNHIAYRFIPGNSEMFVGNIQVELFRSQIPVIAVHQTALIGWGRILKRLSDLLLGGLAFIISLPFLLIIGVVVKVTDPRGPILLRDPRHSRFNTIVTIYKFRTMRAEYSGITAEEAFAKMGRPELIKQYRDGGDQLDHDPRITSFGQFLRKTSLDEIPQFINVVKGDISLVGPRALQAGEYDKYGYGKMDLILAVKSGITGLAQISGRKDISFSERRKLDLYYVQNWSLWADIVIIIKTVRVVFQRAGAK